MWIKHRQCIVPGQDYDRVQSELPVLDVTMIESTSAKRPLDTEDLHVSNEPATEKRHLDLLAQHVLMLHGGETQDGNVNEVSELDSWNVDPDVWTVFGEMFDPFVVKQAKEEELRRFHVMRVCSQVPRSQTSLSVGEVLLCTVCFR